jgi:FKBP-type peptidyl-prolyl cis-trans isomerase
VIRRGIKLLEEREGTGPLAQKGSNVVYNLRVYLNKGGEVQINETAGHPPEVIRHEATGDLLNFVCRIGRRDAFAAVEYALEGMREGGYRKIRSKPQLAYGEAGVPGKIPKNAIVTFEVWLRKVTNGA